MDVFHCRRTKSNDGTSNTKYPNQQQMTNQLPNILPFEKKKRWVLVQIGTPKWHGFIFIRPVPGHGNAIFVDLLLVDLRDRVPQDGAWPCSPEIPS